MNDECKRIRQYVPLIDGGQNLELYPAPSGLEHNAFTFVDLTRSHLKVLNRLTEMEYSIPLALIEFISPGGLGAIIRLTRPMTIRGNALL